MLGGWCHGPPGTARLFLLLHSLTGERAYLDTALASARWVMAQGTSETRGAGARPQNLSFCCGVAGVVDFFCDLYRATGDPQHAEFARRAGGYLVANATRDADGVRWRAAGRAAPRFAVDLMQGAAGGGLALLRLLTLDARPDPMRHLPDRAVAAP
jgi:lantibiotic modifying enzyme